MQKFILWTTAIVLFWCGPSRAADPSYSTLSRCFFVYAPIFETAKKVENPALFAYGQKRLAWVSGYIQGQQSNPQFKAAFEKDLNTNKQAGIALEARLMRAFTTQDAREYSAVMSVARECDRSLGLPTSDIPPP
jgi:hypothetical protein